MLFAFKKAGVFNEISGLIVGGMTDLQDTTPPFGKSVEEIILDKIENLLLPVVFDFPAGHLDDNRALRFGSPAKLVVTSTETSLTFL